MYRGIGPGAGELTGHVAAYPVIKPSDGVQQLDIVEALRKQYADVPNLTIPGLKVFADGVVEFPSPDRRHQASYRRELAAKSPPKAVLILRPSTI